MLKSTQTHVIGTTDHRTHQPQETNTQGNRTRVKQSIPTTTPYQGIQSRDKVCPWSKKRSRRHTQQKWDQTRQTGNSEHQPTQKQSLWNLCKHRQKPTSNQVQHNSSSTTRQPQIDNQAKEQQELQTTHLWIQTRNIMILLLTKQIQKKFLV